MRLKKLLTNGLLWAVIVFLFAYLCFAISFEQYQDVWWDAASYIGMGKYLFSGGQAGVFEPMKPVILPILLGIFYLFNINMVVFGKILILFFSLGSILFVYLFGKELHGKKVGVVAAFLIFLNPLFFIFSFRIYTEMLSVFFILGALLFALKFSNSKRYLFLSLSALFCALSFFSKYPYIMIAVFINLFFIFMYWKNREIKPILWFNTFLLVFLSPFFVLNYYFTGDFLYLFNVAQDYFKENLGNLYSLKAYSVPPLLIETSDLIYFQAVGYLFNILLPFLFLGIYLLIREDRANNYYRNLFLVIIPAIILFLFFEIFYLKQERYILPIFALFSLICAIAISRASKKLILTIVIIYGIVGLVWAGSYLSNDGERVYAKFFSDPPVDLKCDEVATSDPRSLLKYARILFPYEVFDESWGPDRYPSTIKREKPECVFYFSCAENRTNHYFLFSNLNYSREMMRDTGRCAYAIFKFQGNL